MNLIDNRVPAMSGKPFLKIKYGKEFSHDGDVYQRLNRNSHPLTRNLRGTAISGKEGLAVRLTNEGGLQKFNHATMVQPVDATVSIT